MRTALMGSCDPTTSIGDASPRKAFFSQIGVRDAGATPGFGYPFEFTDDEICEIWYRFNELEFVWHEKLEGNDGTDDYVYIGDFTVTLERDGSPADETVLRERGLSDTPPTWTGLNVSGTISEEINGGGPTVTPVTFDFTFRFSTPIGAAEAGVFDPYYYIPDWLPTMEWFLQPTSVLSRQSSLEVLTPAGGESATTEVGQYRGDDFDVSSVQLSYLAVTEFTLTITPVSWFEYRDSVGANPIWNAATGAELIPHSTPVT